MKARLNNKIIDSIVYEINEEINNERNIDNLEILMKELSLTKMLKSDDILKVYNKLKNDINKNNSFISLDKLDKHRIYDILSRRDEFNVNKKNNDKDDKLVYLYDELKRLSNMEILINKMKDDIDKGNVIDFINIPNVDNPIIKSDLMKLKKNHILLYKNSKGIFNKQDEIKNGILIIQKRLYIHLINYVKNIYNEIVNMYGIGDKYHNLDDGLDIFVSVNNLLDVINKNIKNNEFDSMLNKYDRDVVDKLRNIGIDIFDYDLSNLYKIEAENNLFYRLAVHSMEYNNRSVGKGK